MVDGQKVVFKNSRAHVMRNGVFWMCSVLLDVSWKRRSFHLFALDPLPSPPF